MHNLNKSNIISILTTLAYFFMIAMNVAANALPINGITTGAISDSYLNLFAPAGITFSIWGVIYLALGAYVFYQLRYFFLRHSRTKSSKFMQTHLTNLNTLFILSSIANGIWILAWHYRAIGVSVLLMVILLVALILIAELNKSQESRALPAVAHIPFSIYFGWITVATIANVTIFLVSISWDRWEISDVVWTVFILMIGAIIGSLRLWRDCSVSYGLVLLWAYGGILFQHLSSNGFAGTYPAIILAVIVCMGIISGMLGNIVSKREVK